MYFENIIIGAGPAGLQAGYYLHKYEIDYVILEKHDKCGNSFETFPHSGSLLSINKKNTGSINKDLIDVCKDCEFRYICTDCRAYIQDKNNIYSKPAKCNYDPYNAEWY